MQNNLCFKCRDKVRDCEICKQILNECCYKCGTPHNPKDGYCHVFFAIANRWVYLCSLCNQIFQSDITTAKGDWYKNNSSKI